MAVNKWKRLSKFIAERMEHDNIDQAQLVLLSKLSQPTVAALMAGEPRADKPRQKTLRQLEDGLDWRRGSVESILAGGEPVVVVRPTDSVEFRPSVDLGLRLEQLEGVVRQMLKLMTSGGRQSELTLAALADQLERDRPVVVVAD